MYRYANNNLIISWNTNSFKTKYSQMPIQKKKGNPA